MHSVKVHHAREKIALFRQGKLTREQLPKLALRLLEKGAKTAQSAPPSASERKEKAKA